MEAAFINNNLSSKGSLNEVMATFFKKYTPDSTKVLFWVLFQCWTKQDCKLTTELSDQEVALFFDQLINLVAAAHIEHQANRVSESKRQEGGDE